MSTLSHLTDRVAGSLRPGTRREDSVVRSSALLFVGNATARFLGLLFMVAAARLLAPASYGLMAYAVAVAGIGTTLINNAPTGLSRFLARNRDDPAEQDVYFSNWLAIVAVILAASVVLLVPLAVFSGLTGWTMLGLAAILVGMAVFVTYREAQLGLERFGPMVLFYVAANAIELVVILGAGWAGWRDPALFLVVYGLSSVGALVLMQAISPLRLRFVPSALAWARLRMTAMFTLPLMLQTGFYAVWFGADVILLKHFWPSSATGSYAAAKTLVAVLVLAASAISTSVKPRAARYARDRFRSFLLRAVALTAAVVIPSLVVFVLLGHLIVAVTFGSSYEAAGAPLPWLAVGMSCYAFYIVFESVVIGIGRPGIDATATGAGMVITIGAGLVLVPAGGPTGAALAFTLGAAVQLLVIVGFTIRTQLSAARAEA